MTRRHHHRNPAPNVFAQFLRDRRKALDVTTAEIAERLSAAGFVIKSGTVSSWESIGNLPSRDELSKFPSILECTFKEIEEVYEKSVSSEPPPYKKRANGRVSRGKQERRPAVGAVRVRTQPLERVSEQLSQQDLELCVHVAQFLMRPLSRQELEVVQAARRILAGT